MATKGPKQTLHKDSQITAKEKALCYARWALEKKAYDTTVLHLGPISTIAEYFVICSGKSVRQTRAIANHIRPRLKEASHPNPLGTEGEREGLWILMDCDDVVVHVFHEPIREFYSLEKLWVDAPILEDPALLAEIEEATRDGYSKEDDDWEA